MNLWRTKILSHRWASALLLLLLFVGQTVVVHAHALSEHHIKHHACAESEESAVEGHSHKELCILEEYLAYSFEVPDVGMSLMVAPYLPIEVSDYRSPYHLSSSISYPTLRAPPFCN